MIDDQYSVYLSQDCFGACEVLMNTIQGKRVGDLNESEITVLEGLETCVYWH